MWKISYEITKMYENTKTRIIDTRYLGHSDKFVVLNRFRGQALPNFANQNLEGQAMIESIVAISVSVVGLLGIIAMLNYSLNTNRDVGRKFVATYLAAEGIEIVKSLIDKNYTDDISWNSWVSNGEYNVEYNIDGADFFDTAQSDLDRKLKVNNNGVYQYSNGIETAFSRIITITEKSSPANEIVVHSIVSWSADDANKVDLEDHFFDWRL